MKKLRDQLSEYSAIFAKAYTAVSEFSPEFLRNTAGRAKAAEEALLSAKTKLDSWRLPESYGLSARLSGLADACERLADEIDPPEEEAEEDEPTEASAPAESAA